jgi:hypothetical protein
MEEVKAMSLDEIRAFVAASEALRFEGRNRREVYRWIQTTLVQQVYHSLGKKDRGVLRDYLRKMTGFSRAQVTRLIAQYVKTGEVRVAVYRRRKFPSLYTAKDIERLAELDEAHETLSGPATQKILYREYHEFGQDEYERLARISVAHLYNLRKSRNVPAAARGVSTYPAGGGEHRRTAQAGSARPARFPASGQRAPRRPGGSQRGVSH